MKSSAETLSRPGSRSGWVIAVRLLSAVGLALSGYLLWGSLTQDHLPGCGVESGCNVVLHSRWSSWFGFPVSGFAFAIYALVLVGSVMLLKSDASRQKRGWCILIVAASSLASAALWFISLQLFVVQAICPFCMAAHACGLLMSVVLFANLPGAHSARGSGKSATRPDLLSAAMVVRYSLSGLGAVAFLAAGQAVQPIKTYDVQGLAGKGLSTTNIVVNQTGTDKSKLERTSNSPAVRSLNAPKIHRVLQLHGDLFTLDLNEVPLHGAPEAKHVIVHLFDYSCKHCRQLHPILTEAVRGLSNQVAVVSLPMPLDGKCNPMMQRVIPDHTNACAYARAGLAVWRANPEKLEEFDDWIFSPDHPPAPEEVRAEAIRLVGTNAFELALRDSWIDQQLGISIRLYQTNYVRSRKSQLPEMMIGTNIVSGVPPNVDVLYKFLASKFDLRLPEAKAE